MKLYKILFFCFIAIGGQVRAETMNQESTHDLTKCFSSWDKFHVRGPESSYNFEVRLDYADGSTEFTTVKGGSWSRDPLTDEQILEATLQSPNLNGRFISGDTELQDGVIRSAADFSGNTAQVISRKVVWNYEVFDGRKVNIIENSQQHRRFVSGICHRWAAQGQ